MKALVKALAIRPGYGFTRACANHRARGCARARAQNGDLRH